MQHFNIENGLPSNNVYSAVQDDLGYIWFTTDNGIVKYNGYSYKIFNTSNGLPSNDIWKLYPDKRGRLWVHTHTYKIGYIKNDKFKEIISSSSKVVSPGSITCDKDNVYFFYSENNETRLITVDSNDNIKDEPINGTAARVQQLFLSPDCNLWVLEDDNTFYKRNLSRKESLYEMGCTISFDPRHFFSISSSGVGIFHNTLYNFSFLNDYVDVVNMNNCALKRIDFNGIKGERNESVYTSFANNDILILITNKNIYFFDSNFNIADKIDVSSFLKYSSQVAYFLQDKFRNKWFTTNGDGVWCKPRTSGIFHVNDSLSFLFDTRFTGSHKSGASFWWQKENSTLFVLHPDKHVDKVPFPENTLLRGVYTANDSEAFLCLNKMICLYNIRTRKIINLLNRYKVKKINDVNSFNSSNPVTLITDSALVGIFLNNKSYISAIDSSRFFIKGSSSVSVAEIKDHTVQNNTYDNERYNEILYDSVDNLYLLYNIGKISVYNPANNHFTSFTPDQLSLLKITSISALGVDNYSNIYVLDNEKLIMYNVKNNRIKRIESDFNFADVQLRIYNNNIVIAGAFGLAYAKILGPLSIANFYVAPNARNSNYNRLYDLFITNGGNIYLRTDKGIFDVNIGSLQHNNAVFNPSSDEFFKLTLSLPYSAIIKNKDTITVDQKNTEINLQAINFFGTGTVQYKYFISGYNSDWQTSTSGDINIGHIKPDRYYLFKCIMFDNSWKSKEIHFYMYIPPYWYQRQVWKTAIWACIILLILALLLFVILLTRYTVARSNQKKRILTELELKAVYAQINPHFVFNTLSSALYFINNKKFEDAYTHVNKFSRLMRSYLKSSQDRYVILSDEIDMLRNYIELQRTRFEGKFNFNIETDNKIPSKNILIPSLLLQPLVENAINHGLFHKSDIGFLEIKFLQGIDNNELICIIDDNGVGREKAREIKRNSAAQQEAFGTKLTQQLIEIFREYENLDIELKYIDKSFPETGTTVKLTIKRIKYVTAN
jgi:two-component sensor histidine kinase